MTPIGALSIDEYAALMDVNARGTSLAMKHEIPAMRARGGGAICNCASAAGLIPSALQVAYAGAKFAVVGLTRGAALEVAKYNIRVNVVCPARRPARCGWTLPLRIPTARRLRSPSTRSAELARRREVADAVLFLCRDATFTTGHAFPVDGGRTAG